MANQMSTWEPLTLRDAMDRLFDESFTLPMRGRFGRWGREREDRVYQLPVDAYTTEDAVVIEASIPGVDPDKVDITIDGDVVTISAEIPSSPAEGRHYAISERLCGKVQRSLNLNVPVEASKAEASFENGVLTLHLPKSEEIKPKKITVQSK